MMVDGVVMFNSDSMGLRDHMVIDGGRMVNIVHRSHGLHRGSILFRLRLHGLLLRLRIHGVFLNLRLMVLSVSGAVDGGDEAALAMHVVLDGADGAIRLDQAVLALGLVAVTVLVVVLDVVGVRVLHSVSEVVLWVLKNGQIK